MLLEDVSKAVGLTAATEILRRSNTLHSDSSSASEPSPSGIGSASASVPPTALPHETPAAEHAETGHSHHDASSGSASSAPAPTTALPHGTLAPEHAETGHSPHDASSGSASSAPAPTTALPHGTLAPEHAETGHSPHDASSGSASSAPAPTTALPHGTLAPEHAETGHSHHDASSGSASSAPAPATALFMKLLQLRMQKAVAVHPQLLHQLLPFPMELPQLSMQKPGTPTVIQAVAAQGTLHFMLEVAPFRMSPGMQTETELAFQPQAMVQELSTPLMS